MGRGRVMGNNGYGVQLCDADRIEIRFYSFNGCCHDVELDFFFFNDNHSKSFTVDYATGLNLSKALHDFDGWHVEVERDMNFDNPDEIFEYVCEYWDYGA